MLTDVLTQRWTVLLARGLLAVVFGIIAMAAPITAALSLVLLWGLWALVDGLLGVLLMANPGKAALGIAWFIGLLALVWGVALVGLALATRSAQRRAGAHPTGPADGGARPAGPPGGVAAGSP